MKKRKGLEKQRHVVVGAELYKMREELIGLSTELATAYGSSCKASKLAIAALKAVDSLRCELDGQLASGTSKEEWRAERLDHVYYPGSVKQDCDKAA